MQWKTIKWIEYDVRAKGDDDDDDEKREIINTKTYNRILFMIYKHNTRDPHSSKFRLTLTESEYQIEKCVFFLSILL